MKERVKRSVNPIPNPDPNPNYYTYIYSGKRESCEGAELVGVLVAETIHPACVCEGGGRGGERGGRAFYYTYIYSGKR